MPDFPDLSGYIINNGRLELMRSLGSGTYGQVYSAVDLDTQPSIYYAVKCLQRGGDNSRRHSKQKRERRLHATISSHPNVVTFHEALYEEFYVFFVLDLCPGGTLFEAITENKLYYRNDALLKQVLTQIIDAVHYCHENSVFHR